MSNNVNNSLGFFKFTAKSAVLYTVASGAAGYVLTDFSGDAEAGNILIIMGEPQTLVHPIGVRETGSTATPQLSMVNYSTLIVQLDSNARAELYRDALNDTKYYVVGVIAQ